MMKLEWNLISLTNTEMPLKINTFPIIIFSRPLSLNDCMCVSSKRLPIVCCSIRLKFENKERKIAMQVPHGKQIPAYMSSCQLFNTCSLRNLCPFNRTEYKFERTTQTLLTASKHTVSRVGDMQGFVGLLTSEERRT